MSEREKLVEVMARAHIENICKNVPARLRIPYDAMDSDDQDALKENIRAQLAALEAAGVRLESAERLDLEKAARYDVAYSHGFRAGWNAGVDNDNRTSAGVDARQAEAQRVLRSLAASPYAKDPGNG